MVRPALRLAVVAVGVTTVTRLVVEPAFEGRAGLSCLFGLYAFVWIRALEGGPGLHDEEKHLGGELDGVGEIAVATMDEGRRRD